MFIKSLTVVDIVGGPKAGGRGVVHEIKIVQETGQSIVFVQVFNLQSGGVDLMMFEPMQLRRAKMETAKAERLQMLAMEVDA